MKKYLFMIVTAFALAFTSCSDQDEIDIKKFHNLTISVNTSNMYQNIKKDIEDKLGDEPSLKIEITAYIYKEDKFLTEKKTQIKTLSNASLQFENLEEGNYTLILTENIVNTNSSIWEIDGKNHMDSLKILTDRYNPIEYYNCIGVASKTINFTDNASISVTPEILGSIVELQCENVDTNKVNTVSLFLKNVPDGCYLNSKEEYYKGNYLDGNTWNERGVIQKEKSGTEKFFILNTGEIKYCFGITKTNENKSGFYDIPENGNTCELKRGEKYIAYAYYKGYSMYFDNSFETYFGVYSDFDKWYQQLNKIKIPLFEHPCTLWGASVKEVKNYMKNYDIWYDIKDFDGRFYLGYGGLYTENSIQYEFQTIDSNLLNSFVNIYKDDATIDEILAIFNGDKEYIYDNHYITDEYEHYYYYNENTEVFIHAVHPDLKYDDGTSYMQVYYRKSERTNSRSESFQNLGIINSSNSMKHFK